MRERIREAVASYPGIHARALARHLHTSLALVQYHLGSLEAAHEVRSVRTGGFRRYFPPSSFEELTPRERAILNLLRREKPLEIVLVLLEEGRLTHGQLAEALGWPKSVLSFHLDKLVAAGVVHREASGEEKGLELRDAEAVRRILRRFEPIEESAARIHDTWEDLFSGHRRRRRAD